MGQSMSCGATHELEFFRAIQIGHVARVEAGLRRDPAVVRRKTVYDRLSTLHIAAANGRVEVLDLILERCPSPDVVDRRKQTPLMVAAMHGHVSCVERLLRAGANILVFDKLHERTCLHYAAYYGHGDCLEAILSAARSSPISQSWGFSRFVNVRDAYGATPLHLAARRRRPECVHMLLNNGALVSASTGNYGSPGSTPLHHAARGGSLDCVRSLLARGADRLQRDSSGRIPYTIALKRKHGECAALLNPSAAEPLVWPAPLKFINELEPGAKTLLESALMEANRAREKKILKGTRFSPPSPARCIDVGESSSEENDTELFCCICFERPCTIEVRNCRHQMCACCTLALCCHNNKPNPTTSLVPTPVCPFCRSNIEQLAVAEKKSENENTSSAKLIRTMNVQNPGAESSSLMGLTSAVDPFGKLGHGSDQITNTECSILYKPPLL